MNALQEIIQNTKADTEEVPLNYSTLTPVSDNFITNIPKKTYSFTFFDACMWLYSYWLGFVFTCQAISDRILNYRLNKRFKRDMIERNKDLAARKKEFIRLQVDAMKHAIAHFNNYPTCWEQKPCRHGSYQVRNQHNMIKDRSIQRHWHKANPTKLAVS